MDEWMTGLEEEVCENSVLIEDGILSWNGLWIDAVGQI